MKILVVDDEPTIRLTVGDALHASGHEVTVAADGKDALEILACELFDLVITDIRLPGVDGMTIFLQIREATPETDVILMTAYAEVKDAVSALKNGAKDYLTKPFDVEEIALRVGRIQKERELQAALTLAKDELKRQPSDTQIIGRSLPMTRLLSRLETMAQSDAPVLITGESGTGKELVAKSIHRLSPRKDKAFVAVNCAAFPETLLEAELFGHERGAFTGAVRAREGRFRAAHGGTLFLDEIAEIPPMAQAKLLRVLQEGAIEPLGTNTAIEADVRLLSATHQNLKALIKEGRFREDLYYRLNVLDLWIPPLRDRRGDLPLLTEFFLRRHCPGGRACVIAPRAWAALTEYRFPGNVRELEHAMERAVVLSRGQEIDLEHLPDDIVGRTHEGSGSSDLLELSSALKAFEREYLLRALRHADGKKTRAAEMLGISRKNLWEKLRRHRLDACLPTS